MSQQAPGVKERAVELASLPTGDLGLASSGYQLVLQVGDSSFEHRDLGLPKLGLGEELGQAVSLGQAIPELGDVVVLLADRTGLLLEDRQPLLHLQRPGQRGQLAQVRQGLPARHGDRVGLCVGRGRLELAELEVVERGSPAYLDSLLGEQRRDQMSALAHQADVGNSAL